MTTLKLYNTKTRTKEDFTPINPQNVQMYVCGPTVYDRAHLGNARPVIVFDTLFRLLRHVYGAEHVTYVRNFTDVEDKINARAAETGCSIGEITEKTIRWYLEDMAAVGTLEPTQMPRATQYITQMVTMIEDLIARGHAYAAEGHVLFAVESYADYGALSGRSVDDMIAGARVETAPYKRNPMDFVLWKPSDADTPGWDGPVVAGKSIGKGRPGWHIECSAMAYDVLGDRFDIHGGGIDLQFPHHENEIAQSKCAGHDFANVWMHNEMLQVEGKKMSKSLGNFFTVRDLLDQGVRGEVIRFVMLSTHYRKPMDWTEKKRAEAEKTLRDWYGLVEALKYTNASVQVMKEKGQWKPPERLIDVLANDLNTHQALVEVRTFASTGQLNALAVALDFLGLVVDWDNLGQMAMVGLGTHSQIDLAAYADLLRVARADAMSTKNFTVVDRLKATLSEAGIEVRMSKNSIDLVPGPNFNPAKLGALK